MTIDELVEAGVRAGGRGPADRDRTPPAPVPDLSIGIAGEGFDGLLTSDSTRTDGLVTSTDVAPTILDRLGVPVPPEMNGQPIRSTGERDVGAVIDLEQRLEVTGGRRGPVIGETLLVWLVIAGLAVASGDGPRRRWRFPCSRSRWPTCRWCCC